MSKALHILNGDNTLPILEKSGIKGDVVVWREMLCEGPVLEEIGSDDFWMNRYVYFENGIGISRIEYYDKTIKKTVKLEDVSGYNEVVLWFEFDLFCQVNLLALCSYLLNNYVKKTNYYLICTGKVAREERLQSLSDFLPSDFKTLFENKITLSKASLEFGKESWNIYVENDSNKLKSFDFNQNSKFQYLQLAMDQHLNRFPAENGLNQIENTILEIINSNLFSENEIVRKLLIWQQNETAYGFGDLQYFQYLKKLNTYFIIKDSLYYLNEVGKTVVL